MLKGSKRVDYEVWGENVPRHCYRKPGEGRADAVARALGATSFRRSSTSRVGVIADFFTPADGRRCVSINAND